jgi:hypothetical protein
MAAGYRTVPDVMVSPTAMPDEVIPILAENPAQVFFIGRHRGLVAGILHASDLLRHEVYRNHGKIRLATIELKELSNHNENLIPKRL